MALLLIGLLIERKFAQEYINFLEYCNNLQYAAKQLQVGTPEKEVLVRISRAPDSTSIDYDAEGHFGYVWTPKNHQGFLHNLFGVRILDDKSFVELKLEFDKERTLTRIYYGG